ncbi:hypothetical protein QAD02_003028 [Eretmocerus hayati]|uniref:Uncharacterized protein n=1 Tax=Eretmocerus hayati TaxID=131215 RepID=A0ACC2NKI5_9HYME|nr:hypothetical protein QAD02_003028 [Eretmocerus hayati]
MQELTGAGHTCKQADEDADVLIVEYAINYAREIGTPTMIVGEDIDLLVILTQLSNEKEELYFFKPGKGKIPHYYFSCKSFQPNDLSHLVAFFHAFCGCDTVSAIFGKGKNTIVKLFRNKIDLIPLAESFNKSDTPVHELIENGIKIMARLYDIDGNSDDLDEMRYQLFRIKMTKLSFKLESLPPTKKAAAQHILRAYLQVQIWLGNTTITATKFEWYESITSTQARCLK